MRRSQAASSLAVMDKVSLLTASRVEPAVSLSPHSALISRLAPAITFAARFHYLLSWLSSFLYIQTYFITRLAAVNAFYASRFLLVQAFIATKFGAWVSLNMSAKAIADVWEARSTQMLRRKFFYEFAVFVLGSGNAMILLLFWPGWIVVGGAGVALWQLFG